MPETEKCQCDVCGGWTVHVGLWLGQMYCSWCYVKDHKNAPADIIEKAWRHCYA